VGNVSASFEKSDVPNGNGGKYFAPRISRIVGGMSSYVDGFVIRRAGRKGNIAMSFLES
jgi:hypothetical protein